MNPERLINNGVLRTLARHAGFLGTRAVLTRGLVPLLQSPKRRLALRNRVAVYFERFFPELRGPAAVAKADAFLVHYAHKLAEDCALVNMENVSDHLRTINSHVVVRGEHHYVEALARGAGVMVVGAHLGSVAFGTACMMSLNLSLPKERYPVIRLCSEPDMTRFPRVMAGFAQTLSQYDADLEMILTHRENRSVATEMTDTLAAGGVVTSNLDVLMGGGSQNVFPLFGGRARVRLPALVGAAKAAVRSGATILPWINLRTEAGFRLIVEKPLGPVERVRGQVNDDHPAVAALAEHLRRILEGWITATPEQWFYWDRLHHRLVEE